MGAVSGAPDPLIGRKLAGKFVLEHLLGEGAMGAVYRARQVALDKTVAIKVMHESLASDPMFAARFHREAKAASKLDHPNSIRVIDFGEEPDGLLYLAMEYLDGRDLLAVIEEQGPLPARRIVDILSQVLSALIVAHEMGIVHRDLKPENIMVLHRKNEEDAEIDVVKVCDFGIAKMNEGVEREDAAPPTKAKKGKLTTAGLVIGTPEYMSPEQGRGETLDARSDLYSVGVILYHLLTGHTPFEAPTPLGIVVKHQNEAPAPPSTVVNVDPRLEAVCLRALKKQPSERYASAREMRTALRAAVDGDLKTIVTGERVVVKTLESRTVGQTPDVVPHGGAATILEHAVPATPAVAPPGPVLAPKPDTMPAVQAPPPPGTPARRSPAYFAIAVGMLGLGGLAAGGFYAYREVFGSEPVAVADSRPPAASPAAATAATPKGDPAVPALPAVAKDTPPPSAPSLAIPSAPPAKAVGAHHLPAPTTAPSSTVTSTLSATPASPAPPPEPPAPEPPPVELPRPPPPAFPAAGTPAPPFDPRTGTVSVGHVEAGGGVPLLAINRAIARQQGEWTRCYQSGLTADTPQGQWALKLQTNLDGRVVSAVLDSPLPPEMKRCIQDAATRLSFPPDTGSSDPTVHLSFKHM